MEKEEKKVRYRKWKAENESIKSAILQALAMDYAKEKSFSYIWDYVQRKHACTKITLVVYLDYMINKGNKEIKKVDVAGRKKQMYALRDQDVWSNMQKKYEKRMIPSIKRMTRENNALIKKIERGDIGVDAIMGWAAYALSAFEDRQLEGIELLLRGEPIAAIVFPSLIEDYFVSSFNLMALLAWTCFKKNPKATMEAVNLLRMRKREILNLEGYGEQANLLDKNKP